MPWMPALCRNCSRCAVHVVDVFLHCAVSQELCSLHYWRSVHVLAADHYEEAASLLCHRSPARRRVGWYLIILPRHWLQGSGASASASATQAILANPEAAAELFRDPKRLQRLLEENPALISVLKSRLGK